MELKPCPFCGGKAEIQKDVRYPRPRRTRKKAYEVICTNIDCIIYRADNVYYLKMKDAVEAWNKRAEQ